MNSLTHQHMNNKPNQIKKNEKQQKSVIAAILFDREISQIFEYFYEETKYRKNMRPGVVLRVLIF